jgi:hypothetical protein
VAGLDIEELRRHLTGTVVGPDDADWDTARQAWNTAVEQHPAAVAFAVSAQDVAATLAHAAGRGLRVAPQATGHGATSLGALDDTILLRTTRLADVAIDEPRRRARVGAGALWRDVAGPAAEHGLVGLHGLSGAVGVAGYTLGGGLGWFSRSHGLACNAVTALEVVLADGRTLTVDAESEPDLFWALRGGGGAGAIVTALEFELFPLREAFAGQLAWPIAGAAEVVEAYRAWTPGLPVELSSTIRLMRFPPVPALPPDLRGHAFVIVTLVFAGDEQAGAEHVAPLRAVGPTAFDTLGMVGAGELGSLAGDPEDPVAGIGDSALLAELDAGAYLAVGGPQADTVLTNVEIRHLGGALADPAPGHGAAGVVDAPFLFYAVGSPVSPESAGALRAELDRARETLSPSSTGKTLLTFAERHPGVGESLGATAAERLQEVTRRYDPGGAIVASHDPSGT